MNKYVLDDFMKKYFAFILSLALISVTLCSCSRTRKEYVRNTFAFDTYVTIRIYETDGTNSESSVCDSAVQLLSELEKQLSVTDSESEISKINKNAFSQRIKVEPQLYWLIRNCVDLSVLTDGAFDCSLGDVSALWGFFEDKPQKPDFSEIEKLAGLKSYEKILFDDENLTVGFSADDFSLDLGAVGKGYALDMLKTLFEAQGVTSAVIDFGGSILTIGNNNGDGWSIGVSDGNDLTVGTLLLPSAFISTSNGTNRYVEYDGVKYHHIIDGSTAYPADSDIVSCTVIADNGIISDAMSTAAYVMGKDRLLEFYSKYPVCEFVITDTLGNVTVTDGIKDSFTENE